VLSVQHTASFIDPFPATMPPLSEATKALRRDFPTRDDCRQRLNKPDFAEASKYVEERVVDDKVEYWLTPAFTPKHKGKHKPRQIIWSTEIPKLKWPLESARLLDKNIVVGKDAAREYLTQNFYLLTGAAESAGKQLTDRKRRWCYVKGLADIVRMHDITEALQKAAASTKSSKAAKKNGKCNDDDDDDDDDNVGHVDNRGDGHGEVNPVGKRRSGQGSGTPAQKRARLAADSALTSAAAAAAAADSSSSAAVVVPAAFVKFKRTVWSLHQMLVGLRTSAPSPEWLRSEEFSVLVQYLVNALASLDKSEDDDGLPPPDASTSAPGDNTRDSDVDSDSS
jgi:hypothetical protein